MAEKTLTTEQMREYVEQRWGCVVDSPPVSGGCFCMQLGERWFEVSTLLEAIRAAYDFTIERERKIAEVVKEIQTLEADREGVFGWGDSMAEDIYLRILAREQAALAELRRGMKEQR